MIRVRIETNHPIDSSRGFESWDGKEHQIDALDLVHAGRLVKRVCGFTPDTRPGTSRMIDGVPHFFPRKYTTGLHCARVVRVTE